MTNDFNSLPSSSNKVLKYWRGLGAWNIYFILKLALLWYGYLNFHPLANLVFLAFLLFPLPSDLLHKIRQIIAIPIGFALLWHDTWLPGLDSIRSQKSQVLAFSWEYVTELFMRFINWNMIGAGFILIVAYLFISQWVRVTVFVVCAVIWLNLITIVPPAMSLMPSGNNGAATQSTTTNSSGEKAEATGAGPAQSLPPTTQNLNAYLTQFYDTEKNRVIHFPDALPADAEPFDILVINVCSLSWSDIQSVNLASHPLWQQFDIIFDNFNSVTSYSGPASIRLLRANCGQVSHAALYEPVAQECYLFDDLARLGFSRQLMIDHSGLYGNYLNNLRHYADMQEPLQSNEGIGPELNSFSGGTTYNGKQILERWLKGRIEEGTQRNAAFFNVTPLHDGMRFLNENKPAPYQPRAQKLLDEMNSFLIELEKSGRKVMVVFVPEHGGAVVGDRMQISGLRDIPSPSITHVPTAIKFIGLKTPRQGEAEHVKEQTSYLALAELLTRVVDGKIFVSNSIDWAALVQNLPQTPIVSENSNAVVMEYQDKTYVRLSGGDWVPYPAS